MHTCSHLIHTYSLCLCTSLTRRCARAHVRAHRRSQVFILAALFLSQFLLKCDDGKLPGDANQRPFSLWGGEGVEEEEEGRSTPAR